jgi:iron complex transport system ATP-binding protein
MTSSLQATGITTRLGDTTVLFNLDLPTIQAAQVCALMGPNGCGKSTLLKSLAGLIKCDIDSLTYADKRLLEDKALQTRPLFGYLPQHLPDGPTLTVLEAIRVAQANTCASSKHLLFEEAEFILAQLGLLALANERADQLSGGQKQLVALGQLLCRKPRILLLDEPFSALDMAHTYAVMNLLKGLTVQHKLITIFVTHDLNFALSNADLTLLMKDGRLNSFGASESVLNPERIATVFGVQTRLERCRHGHPFIFIDGPATHEL